MPEFRVLFEIDAVEAESPEAAALLVDGWLKEKSNDWAYIVTDETGVDHHIDTADILFNENGDPIE